MKKLLLILYICLLIRPLKAVEVYICQWKDEKYTCDQTDSDDEDESDPIAEKLKQPIKDEFDWLDDEDYKN